MTPFRFLVLVGITMTWGLHFSVIKSTVGDIPPIFYVTLRMALVAILLSPLLRWYPGQMRNIMLAGFFYGGINYVFMFSGLNFITASLGSILMQTYVPFAMLFSVLFLGEVIQWRRILGLILAFSGIFIIISAGGDLTGSDNLILGATLVVAAAACEAGATIFIRQTKGVPPLGILVWAGIIGALVTAPLTFFVESDQLAFWNSSVKWEVLSALSYSVLMASVVSGFAYYWLLQKVSVSQVASGTFMTTIFAVIFGVVLMNDPFTLQFLIGGLITMTGIAIIIIRNIKVKANIPFISPQGAARRRWK